MKHSPIVHHEHISRFLEGNKIALAPAKALSHEFADPDAVWRCGNDEAFIPSDSHAM